VPHHPPGDENYQRRFTPIDSAKIGGKVTRRKSRMFNYDLLEELQFWRDYLSDSRRRSAWTRRAEGDQGGWARRCVILEAYLIPRLSSWFYLLRFAAIKSRKEKRMKNIFVGNLSFGAAEDTVRPFALCQSRNR
jgi:hypothetical protein